MARASACLLPHCVRDRKLILPSDTDAQTDIRLALLHRDQRTDVRVNSAPREIPADCRDAYLALVADIVQGHPLYTTYSPAALAPIHPARRRTKLLSRLLARRGLVLAEKHPIPPWRLTIIGPVALHSFRHCIENVLRAGVPGDVIETGVWRGGASIYARAVIRAWGATDRRVWLADSFQGFPTRDVATYPPDRTIPAFNQDPLWAVSLEQVRSSFDLLGLLDDQVRFVKGWFKDTLPALSGERWSVIRLDGDYYESTIQALDSLYPNLSPGGWTIVDDYHMFEACRAAVDDYRAQHGICEEVIRIDDERVMWQRDHP